MSVQELKIREEIELDVENNLEEEIKEEIYHLALKLHRLYQHQKKKTLLNQSFDQHQNDTKHARKKMLSEVNINIKLEGGTTIQIKEIKKEARGSGRPNVPVGQGKTVSSTPRKVKFNWARTLRSEGSSTMSDNLDQLVRSRGGARGLSKAGEGGYGNRDCITRGGWKY